MATNSLEFVITAVDKASNVIGGVGNSAETAGGKFEKFRGKANIAMAAVGVAAAKFGSDSVAAYRDAQQSQTLLEAAYERFPTIADTNIEALRQLNDSLQAKTGIDGDATAAAQASLAAYGLTGAQIAQLTPLMQDYATKTGQDVTSAADSLGKALLGQGRALKDVGIDFQDTGTLGGNFDSIISGLDSKVGGLAVTMGDTAAGKAAILDQTFGDLQEKVGEGLTPILTELTDTATGVLNWLTSTPGAMEAVAVALGVMAAAWLVMNVAASPWLLIGAAVAAVIVGIILAIKNWGKIVDWLQGVWGGVSSWFKGIVDNIGGFFSGLVDHIRDIFKVVANVVTAPFRAAFNGLARIWNSTVGKIEVNIPDWVPGLGGKTFGMPDLPTIPAFANGVTNYPGGLALVGERGPEVVRLPPGSDVIPNGQGTSGMTVNVGSLVAADPATAVGLMEDRLRFAFAGRSR